MAASPAAGTTAGRLLREAREKQGLHIAALAASIKVTPKKLELLESDRFDLLPDATFARALAQTVCRALKIDSAPVMRLLPPPAGHRLEQVGEGLNARFRDRPGLPGAASWSSLPASLAFWATAVILLAALVIYFLPAGLLELPFFGNRAAPQETASPATVVTPIPSSATAVEPLPASDPSKAAGGSTSPMTPGSVDPVAVVAEPAASATNAGSGAPAGVLQLRATAASWIEVIDGSGQLLLSRLVQPGEEIGVDGTAPFKLKIGNVNGTRLIFRGQPIELAAFTRDNVARFELK